MLIFFFSLWKIGEHAGNQDFFFSLYILSFKDKSNNLGHNLFVICKHFQCGQSIEILCKKGKKIWLPVFPPFPITFSEVFIWPFKDSQIRD